MDQTADPALRNRVFAYDGRIGDLYGIFLLNLLLTVLTLGIFRFWAITRMRRYIWSRLSFQSERLEYTGTGGELFVGFLLAGLILIGAVVCAMILSVLLRYVWWPLTVLPFVGLYVVVAILAAGAVFSAQRYRLSRTHWCGIRGGMVGSLMAYGVRSLLYLCLAFLTLFQMVPWMQVRLAERRINASSFGSAPFRFQGSARYLYPRYLATFVAGLVLFVVVAGIFTALAHALVPQAFDGTLERTDTQTVLLRLQALAYVAMAGFIVFGLLSALVQCWYVALFERHVVGNTTLGAMRLGSTMTGGALLGLVLGNLLITIATLGLGLPIVVHRNVRFLASTLWHDGALDLSALAQTSLAGPRFGEGMYQQLDAGGIL